MGNRQSLPDKLIRACEKGNLKLVKKLIEKGADVNSIGENSEWDKRTPIGAAVEREHKDIVVYLLEKGADPVKTIYDGGWTPLMIAAAYNADTDCIKLLLEQQNVIETINLSDFNGKTALDLAETINSKRSSKQIIKLLVEKGGRQNLKM